MCRTTSGTKCFEMGAMTVSGTFGHEKLKVYQKGMGFVVMRKALLDCISRRVAACEHLDRGAESILLNIAHASSSRSPRDRIAYLGHANGSALECAACLDVLVAKALLTASDVRPGKRHLREIVSMLIAMKTTAAKRVREARSAYDTGLADTFFSHENLEVYQTAVRLTGWVGDMCLISSCSADLRTKLDKSTTAIALNIAEGNGRFTGPDQAKFLGIAYRASVQSASLVDLAAAAIRSGSGRAQEGREMLRRIAAMLTSLSKVASGRGR